MLAWDLGSDLTESRTGSHAALGRTGARGRSPRQPAADLPPADRSARLQPGGRPAADRPPAAGHESGTERLRDVGPPAAVAGPAGHARLDDRADAAQRGACGSSLSPWSPALRRRLCVSPEQIRLLAYTAVASGSRGLLFLSDSPLGRGRRRDAAAGHDAGTAQSGTGTDRALGGGGQLSSATAESERTPDVRAPCCAPTMPGCCCRIWSAPMAQYVPPQSAANALTLVVPGVPEARGLRTDARRRAAAAASAHGRRNARHLGRVRPDHAGALGARSVDRQRRATPRGRDRDAARPNLHRDLAVHKLNTVQTLAGQLAARTACARAAEWLEAARQRPANVRPPTGRRRCAGGRTKRPAGHAIAAIGGTRLLGRRRQGARLARDQSRRGQLRHAALALAAGRSAGRLPLGPNRIAGGDFEDLDTMMRAGWRYIQHRARRACRRRSI